MSTSWLQRLCIASILLAGLAVSTWLRYRLEQDNLPEATPAQQEPDAYMEAFTRTDMDEQGRVKSRLQAKRMLHFAVDGATRLSEPTMQLHEEDQRARPWHARSDYAWVSGEQDVVLMYGHVRIWRNDAQGQRELEVRSEDLRVLPGLRYAETDTTAIIVTPQRVTRGVGMRANLATSQLDLLNDVHTRQAPR